MLALRLITPTTTLCLRTANPSDASASPGVWHVTMTVREPPFGDAKSIDDAKARSMRPPSPCSRRCRSR